MELAGDFQELLSSIEPNDRYVTKAQSAHEKVREQLRADADFKEAHKDTFLSGSYARHTAINDINDVDVICIIDIDETTTKPDLVLAWVQSILGKYYDKPKLQGRSVGVTAANGVWLDLVPTTPMGADDGPLWIPDREAKEWVPTHPKGQIQAARSKNQATDGYHVQTVKLMKFWRDSLADKSSQAKSYLLESLVHQKIGLPSSHAAAVVSVLEGIESAYGWCRGNGNVPTISDPGYSSVNVAKHWAVEDFNNFMAQVKTASVTARKALEHRDEVESRKLWRKLFGNDFGS